MDKVPSIERLCDRSTARSSAVVRLRPRYRRPLPMAVIGDMLGVLPEGATCC